jgi:phage I-like protein
MAAAEKWGNDYAIDLEHYSVRPRMVDPMSTDADARGYFRPEMRGGELWAVNVTWTPDGEERLRARRQRYMSPAFYTRECDDTTGMPRVTGLINVALCAQPASDQIDALVASAQPLDNVPSGGYAPSGMTSPAPATPAVPAQTPPVAAAAPPAELPIEVVVELPAEDPALAAAELEATAVEAAVLSLAGETSLRRALVVLNRRLLTASGSADLASALHTFTAALSERTAARTAELRSLVTDLITLGAETPATAWANNAPAPRLASEGIDALRARVAALRASRPASPALKPPTAPAEAGLTEGEQAYAASITDPERRNKFVSIRREIAARAGK